MTSLMPPSSLAPHAASLGSVADWAVSVMDALGAPGAGVAIALENIFPPIPSEVILPLAGFAASRGEFGVLAAIVWTTIGSVVGAVVLYLLGAWLGNERLRRIVDKMPLVKAADYDKTNAWFHRHGAKAVFFGRMIPLFRSFISVPAGVTHMPMGRFVLLTAAGSLVWNTVFVLAGYHLGENWQKVEAYAGAFQGVVIAGVVVAAMWFAVRRVRGSASRGSATDAA